MKTPLPQQNMNKHAVQEETKVLKTLAIIKMPRSGYSFSSYHHLIKRNYTSKCIIALSGGGCSVWILSPSGGRYNCSQLSAEPAFSLFCHSPSAFSGSLYIRPETLQMTACSVCTFMSPYVKIYFYFLWLHLLSN